MLSCAGAYVSGAASSNACPAGSIRIETQAACLTAVAAAGKTVASAFMETSYFSPRGCYYSGNNAFFNTHEVGAGESGSQLLCAAVTTGAPPPPPPPPLPHSKPAPRRDARPDRYDRGT